MPKLIFREVLGFPELAQVYRSEVLDRILPAIETTGTFKVRKVDLVADGYDPGKIKGPLYWRDPKKGYVKLTKGMADKIASGAIKL